MSRSVLARDLLDRAGALGAEQLEADLRRRHVRRDSGRPPDCVVQVGGVERDGDRRFRPVQASSGCDVVDLVEDRRPTSGAMYDGVDPLRLVPASSNSVDADSGAERLRILRDDQLRFAVGEPDRLLQAAPCRVQPSTSRSSRDTRLGAPGSLKMTVPTWTALAPARMNWKASSPVRIPPMPKIGTSGIAW